MNDHAVRQIQSTVFVGYMPTFKTAGIIPSAENVILNEFPGLAATDWSTIDLLNAWVLCVKCLQLEHQELFQLL